MPVSEITALGILRFDFQNSFGITHKHQMFFQSAIVPYTTLLGQPSLRFEHNGSAVANVPDFLANFTDRLNAWSVPGTIQNVTAYAPAIGPNVYVGSLSDTFTVTGQAKTNSFASSQLTLTFRSENNGGYRFTWFDSYSQPQRFQPHQVVGGDNNSVEWLLVNHAARVSDRRNSKLKRVVGATATYNHRLEVAYGRQIN